MARGKVRRWILLTLFRRRTARDMARRRNACARCGACCKLVYRCPAFDDSTGRPGCTIYGDRPAVCGLFPLNEKDLADRDIVLPAVPCGFSFSDSPPDAGEEDHPPLRRRISDLNRNPAPMRIVRGTLGMAKRILLTPIGSNGRRGSVGNATTA